jgi:hypothetical protein
LDSRSVECHFSICTWNRYCLMRALPNWLTTHVLSWLNTYTLRRCWTLASWRDGWPAAAALESPCSKCLSTLGPKIPTIICQKLLKNAVLCLAIISSIVCWIMPKTSCFSAATVVSVSLGIELLAFLTWGMAHHSYYWKMTIDTSTGIVQ